ncbi:MAG: hypothetical protein LBL43_02320, partial [Treponema sp.]|nr:hypothetical protein [Treponema sp.]
RSGNPAGSAGGAFEELERIARFPARSAGNAPKAKIHSLNPVWILEAALFSNIFVDSPNLRW